MEMARGTTCVLRKKLVVADSLVALDCAVQTLLVHGSWLVFDCL